MSRALGRIKMVTQIVGRVQAACTPSGHGPEHRELYLSPRGFRTGMLKSGIELWIDLLQRNIRIVSVDGGVTTIDITDSDAETIAQSVAQAINDRSTDLSIDPPDVVSAPGTLRTSSAAELLAGWAGIHEIFTGIRTRIAAPATEVTMDPETLDLGIRLYSGVVPPGDSGPGETIRVWLSSAVETEEEAAFLAELTPAADRPAAELRPSGAKWVEDGTRARLVYRAIAPRIDWPTALGWFSNSAVAALSHAARWDIRALGPTAIDE